MVFSHFCLLKIKMTPPSFLDLHIYLWTKLEGIHIGIPGAVTEFLLGSLEALLAFYSSDPISPPCGHGGGGG